MGLFGAGSPPCPAGSICSGQSKTPVGRTYRQVRKNLRGGRSEVVTQAVNTGTDIYHASATKLNPDGSSTTDVYIIKDGSWQKAATTNDGGKTYTYDDNVAGAGLQKELSDPQGAIHKNVDANINKAAEREGLSQTDKNKLLDTNPNKADATEDGSADNVYYQASQDIQNGTGFQSFAEGTGNDNDSCMDGYLHIYNPAGTTHVKLFHTSMMCQRNNAMAHGKASGYFNTTNAINAVKFQLSSGNIDAGTISMYGLN
jgi:hypothetical protein